jgi:hypothetical protein
VTATPTPGTRRTTWPSAVELQQAADKLRTGTATITDPESVLIADWLDETANALSWLAPFREHEPGYGMWEAATAFARRINRPIGSSCE